MRLTLATALCFTLCAAWVVVGASTPVGQDFSPAISATGQRFYTTGLTPSGRPVRATVQGDIPVTSAAMPCVNCHRKSGWGTTEGPVTTPAVTGPVLFSPVTLGNAAVGIRSTGPGTRPAYDDRTLLRALRDGVDPAGRRLSPTMPRYEIGDADAAALTAFLRALGAAQPEGVTESKVHLATITSPTADPARKASMLAVLRTFVRDKNAGTRNETRRRERGPWDMKAHYELYRDWVLHEWTLTGDPAGWPGQLAEQYARQPVFAVVGGTVDGDWAPVHAFCEQAGLPCVFPQTDAPPALTGDSFYSIYFSPGVRVETAALASHIRKARASGAASKVVQVSRCGSSGEVGARALAAALGDSVAVTRCVDRPAGLTASGWRQILGVQRATVVAWLDHSDAPALTALAASPDALDAIDAVYLSSSLMGAAAELPAALRPKAFLLSSSVEPSAFDRHASRGLAWAKSRGIEAADRGAAVNALFASAMVADALATPRAIRSREYFVEQFEHMIARTPLPTAYPSVSLGAGRRFASLGCAVLKVPAEPGGAFTSVSPWVVPDLPAR